MKKLIFIGLLFFVSFCAREEIDIPEEIATLENLVVVSGDQEPLFDMELKRQVTFGDSEDLFTGQITSVSIDDNGNVYMADMDMKTIHVFTPDGNYAGSIGREGDGPGEFRQLFNIATNDTHLIAFDIRGFKISIFELDTREFVKSFILPFTPEVISSTFSWPMSYYLPNNKNHLLVNFGINHMQREGEYTEDPVLYGQLLNIDTELFEEGRVYEVPISENIVDRDNSGMTNFRPEYKRESHILITDDFIATAWDEHLLFKIYDYERNYIQAIYYPVNKIPTDTNEIIRSYDDSNERWQRLVRSDNIPEYYPAFQRARIDDENRIWVSAYTDDMDIVNWKVFTLEGDLYTSFNWPVGNIITHIKNGFVYTYETDEDTGVNNVVRYSFLD